MSSQPCQSLSLPYGCSPLKACAEGWGNFVNSQTFPVARMLPFVIGHLNFQFVQQPFQGSTWFLSCFLLRPAELSYSASSTGFPLENPTAAAPCTLSVFAVCSLPPEPENGGYICHPRPCRDPLNAGSVIEYLCAEGYVLKGDYKYLTCKNGEWKPAMEVSCRLNEGQSGR